MLSVPRLSSATGRPWALVQLAAYVAIAIVLALALSAVHGRRVAKLCAERAGHNHRRSRAARWPATAAAGAGVGGSVVLLAAARGQFLEAWWLLVAGAWLGVIGRAPVRVYRALGGSLIAAALVVAGLQDAAIGARPSFAGLLVWLATLAGAVLPVAVYVNRRYLWR